MRTEEEMGGPGGGGSMSGLFLGEMWLGEMKKLSGSQESGMVLER